MNVYCKNMIIFLKKEASINNLYINDDIYITYIVLLSSMKLQETKKTKFSMYHVSVCKAIN